MISAGQKKCQLRKNYECSNRTAMRVVVASTTATMRKKKCDEWGFLADVSGETGTDAGNSGAVSGLHHNPNKNYATASGTRK